MRTAPGSVIGMIALKAGAARALVAPEAGGRIASLVVHGAELLVTEQHATAAAGKALGPYGWGMFPMAPWAGRIRHGRFSFEGRSYVLPINRPPHAIHGTLADRPASGAEAGGSTEAVVTWDLDRPWPFAGQVIQSFALAEDGLALSLEVRADETMPVTCGWHPWWSTERAGAGPAELEFRPAAMYRRDEEGIPTGELVPPTPGPWDDCFPMPPSPIRIRWPHALEVTLESDCADVVVFTERPYGICVEPQTGPPDAVNLGIHCAIVRPGEPLIARARWTWRRLD